jgi:uncharacterized protein YbaP (TraB family)
MAPISLALPRMSGSGFRRRVAGLALLLCCVAGPATAEQSAGRVQTRLGQVVSGEREQDATQAPATLRLAELSQNYRPHPAIWRIGDRDTTIYLFGTVHVLPPGFAWRDARIDAIVAKADTLIVEAVDEDAPSDFTEAHRGAALPPLSRRVSPDHRMALTRFLDSLPPEATPVMDGMPTWIAAIAVGFTRDMQAGELPGPGADDWIEAQFRRARKPVVAIENGREVMRRVSAVPEREQRRMLDEALDAPTPTRAERRAPTHAWAKGEIGTGSALTATLSGPSGSKALSGPLMTDRNRAWTNALVRRLKVPGTALFAAGAGHFIGPDSVLELLRQRGVPVTRVQ